MLTLSYGYSKPQTGDKGATIWSALEADIQQLNDHTHDGVTSALIPAKNLASTQGSILAAAWATYGGAPTGFYRQTVTMPVGYSFDTTSITFQSSAGAYVYPTVEKVTNTTYYIYTTDNTLALTAKYGI